MQYLYSDGELYHFMDVETYDQIALNEDAIGDSLKFVKENEMVKICSHNGNVFAVEPLLFVELAITETEQDLKEIQHRCDKTSYCGDRSSCIRTVVCRTRRCSED